MDLSQRLPRRYSQSPEDVFALVRHHICDVDLSQPPLLMLPGCEKNLIRQFWKNAARHQGLLSTIDPERQRDLLELSQAFQQYPQYERAVHYYRSLAGAEHRTRLLTCPLSFLEMGGVHEPGLVCARLPPRVPKPKPHPLQVRFHRSG